MSSTAPRSGSKATTTTVALAFLSVYFFWGSTYTAIRIGAGYMPALLLAGTRFPIAGIILLAWCRWRGLRIIWPARAMFIMGLVGFLLLGVSNVLLIYAEVTVPSGLSSLVYAIMPLYVAILELFLPNGEPLPLRGWLGLLLGFAGLATLLWPSLHNGLGGSGMMLWAILALLVGPLAWAIAGLISLILGTALGEWPRFHLNAASVGSLAWLITGGSLIGYTAFIYLLEHVPVAKVTSYTYVNPVVAVLLGILLLHERPAAAEFIGMAAIVVAVFLLTTAQIKAKTGQPVQELEQMPAE
jgi:drug/metabolite transporter (DMT)-like permease